VGKKLIKDSNIKPEEKLKVFKDIKEFEFYNRLKVV
jgi:hypothetical protein